MEHNQPIFAIIAISGKQYKVTPGDIIIVNRLNARLGSKIKLLKTLLVSSLKHTIIGQPIVKGSFVEATVLDHYKQSKKLGIARSRAKQSSHLLSGQRSQKKTRLKIDNISI